MQIGQLVRFNEERFFEGAVQLRWVQDRPERARAAASAFVFHGPRYHGASDAVADGIDRAYGLVDTASFVDELVASFQAGLNGQEVNPFRLAVASYGTGKSHLGTAIATLLGAPEEDTAQRVMTGLARADEAIAARVAGNLQALGRPVLVLCLDGMAGFHLGHALGQTVFAALARHGVDAGAIRELSPRFQIAAQFVERNAVLRADEFAKRLPGLEQPSILERLRDQDEAVYTEVDALYSEANGAPIPVTGQESAQDLINTLAEVYCGADGPFAGVLMLFDEFGRFLEYVADKPQLAGDAALQQLFQGVQDNAAKVRFIGLTQYELKTYLKRFGNQDQRHIQRYVTRFNTAKKQYLSTNLETLFAHMIAKDDAAFEAMWQQSGASRTQHLSWQRLSAALPDFHRHSVWAEPARFERVIAQGGWPLHPLATWFLTRQGDVVQSRSALTFIKDVIGTIANEEAVQEQGLRQVSAAELVLHSLLPELIAAEQHSGSTVAETLHMLLEKFQAHLSEDERRVVAGTAVLEKMRIGKQSLTAAEALLVEATALAESRVKQALRRLTDELGALEWNADLGQYELIADASTRGQFQQWLRQRLTGQTAEQARQLFVARAPALLPAELGDQDTDFGPRCQITTPDWRFAAQPAHRESLGIALETAFKEWRAAQAPNEPKGRLIFLYLHPEDDSADIGARLAAEFSRLLKQHQADLAPIWVVGICDEDARIASQLGRLHLFDNALSSEEQERFRRFLPDERSRALEVLRSSVQEAIKARQYWVAGLAQAPAGRLKQAGTEIFAQVYPQALPFPFDGFATSAGGGAADAAQLTRSLIAGQVNGTWVQAQPKRLQNRVSELLVRNWRALGSNGQLTEPLRESVKIAFEQLKHAHIEQPQRALLDSYRALIAPPFGMNSASAAVLLGLLIAGAHPPRRLEHKGELVPVADWVARAFPAQRGKHQLEQGLLGATQLRFLSEDSEGRWRELLNRWNAETRYDKLVALAKEADKMRRAEAPPEALEGSISYQRDKSIQADQHLREARARITTCEQTLERAERQNQVGELLKTASQLFRAREDFEDEQRWPAHFAEECNKLLAIAREFIGYRIDTWIAHQSCHNASEVAPFRARIQKAVASLRQLGFETEAQRLEDAANRTILMVEERQKFRLILDESDEYPRRPGPDASTLARELRDAIARGTELIKGVQSAHSVLLPEEIQARIKAIESRQQVLNVALKKQRDTLGAMYDRTLADEAAVRETLAHLGRLRGLFLETPDEAEITALMRQLQRIAADLSAWEHGELSPERLRALLDQRIPEQLAALNAELAEHDIEPAWDLEAIYRALAAQRIAAQERRSTDWMKPRLSLADQLPITGRAECERLRTELTNAPDYLSAADRAALERLLALSTERLNRIDAEERQRQLAAWRAQFPQPKEIGTLDRAQTDVLLRALDQPPAPLTAEEQTALEPLRHALSAHYDDMSTADILTRIQRLSIERQRAIYHELAQVLAGELLHSAQIPQRN